jgi:protein ImuB
MFSPRHGKKPEVVACLFGNSPRLAELADQFSPVVERVSADMVVFSVDGLGSLFGDSHQIASEISRRGAAMNLDASLAIAVNKSTAMVAARNFPGVTIIAPGREADVLASIPIEMLPAHPALILTLDRWGIHTLGGLAALPQIGIVERLGDAGYQLWRLAIGQGSELISVSLPAAEYTLRQEFDDPVELLESLLFVISAQLHDLTQKLQQNGRAASRITITLPLDRGGEFVCSLDLPFAMRDPVALLKQIQLSLEAKPPEAAAVAVQTTLESAEPRVTQGGLFQPVTPEPEKLQTLLARLRALAGAEHVGSPEILDTHRPDAYRLRPCAFEVAGKGSSSKSQCLRLALRYFRPPLAARVAMQNSIPRRVFSERISGEVIQSAGPWRKSGGLWSDTSWERDEWDIVLDDRAVYQIYLTPADQWFLNGSYD